ncbi:MAG: c-type cytochrome biogenesis protein CcmI [Gammaproteobacteria bacterium]
MMVFWVVAVLLIAAALLFLLPPLVQKVKDETSEEIFDRDELNVTIFKDQLAELERDLSVNILSAEQFELAKHDLERSFLQGGDAEAKEPVSQMDRVVGRSAAVVISILIPVLAVVLYNALGAGEAGLHPKEARPNVQAEGHDGSLEEQIRNLQDRLQTNPDDIDSWVMLARSYYFMKQYAAASKTFARASSMLKDSNPELLADYADAQAMANGRNMAGRPYELAKKALAINPQLQKALWLAGTASYQAQDYPATLEYWKRLAAIFPKDSDNYKQMQKNIGEMQQKLGLPIDSEIMAAANASTANVSETSTATGGVQVTGVVTLADAFALNASIDDTLFVFARAATGPRMPLAIVRKTVKDLPLTFTLNDSMAMRPDMKISNFQEIIIGARISKSGNAMPQSGDMEGSFGPVDIGDASGVEIIIDKMVQ